MTAAEIEKKKQAIDELRNLYHRAALPSEIETRVKRRVMGAHDAPGERIGFLLPAGRWMLAGTAAVCGLLALAIMLGLDGGGNGLQAVVTQTTGCVHVSHDGTPVPFSKETPLEPGSLVSTEGESQLSLRIGPHRVLVAETTRLALHRLHEDDLALRLERGDVSLEVTPLASHQRMTVETKRVTVTVVGTVFQVTEGQHCTRVAVQKGRVRTTTPRGQDFIGKGESRRFCDEEDGDGSRKAQVPTAAPPGTPDGAGNRAIAEHVDGKSLEIPDPRSKATQATDPLSSHRKTPEPGTEHADQTLPGGDPKPQENPTFNDIEPIVPPRGASQGEEIYEAAHEAILRGDIDEADRLLTAYLQRHPNGDLAEDALFRKVRLAYRQRRSGDVCTVGKRFLKQFPQSRYRVQEVRILCAESALSTSGEADDARRMLAPLVRKIRELSDTQRQQVTYLMFRAACTQERQDDCRTWSGRYLDRYPEGRFAEEAKKHLERGKP